ncbi:ADP-ribosylglycohydrolase family protein [Cupriavidus necator]|uniref:ADP-ribosylglycohydrolase family protein n=1 Tax=Cupriavidus necator TaxID=106590 RepID=UPI003B8A66AD
MRGFPKHDAPCGTGYVLDTIWSARRALEESTFEDVVRTAVQFGNDTDTTACLTGGLAGIRFGLDSMACQRFATSMRTVPRCCIQRYYALSISYAT